ncbi:MAG: hypothetical protein RSH79_04850 [Clostridiales bacterium]
MPRYIDADALFEKLLKTMDGLHAAAARHDGNDDHQGIWMAEGMGAFLSDLNHYPTADVALVVYGKWAHLGGDEFCCTNCWSVITTEGSWENPYFKHCPNCGAKMDLEKENGE